MKKNCKVVKLHGVTYDVRTHNKPKKDWDLLKFTILLCILVIVASFASHYTTKQSLIENAKLYINEDTAYVDFGGEVHEYDYTPITGRYVK